MYKYQAKTSEEQSRQETAESLSADATKPVNTSRLKQLTDKFLQQNTPNNEGEEKDVEKGEKFRQVLEKLDQLMKMDQEKNEMVDTNQNFDV